LTFAGGDTMRVENFSKKYIDRILAEIKYDINALYGFSYPYSRNQILDHLRDKIFMLEYAIKAINQPEILQNTLSIQTEANSIAEPLKEQQTTLPENKTTFTLQELSQFDGKGGNPTYIAVNGTVYDVTNSAFWAAATHFGLKAGMDLSKEFASCHAGQPVLNKLKVVGKLV
jgi:predicted heme/steroid binding protein